MSYRAFKRLLGETSLERKCRFLFGAGILLLITVSFTIYANQTESLAYDQTITTARLLVTPIFERHHLPPGPPNFEPPPPPWANNRREGAGKEGAGGRRKGGPGAAKEAPRRDPPPVGEATSGPRRGRQPPG